jgi:RimJ/RimL family protein N-acetyltransferase
MNLDTIETYPKLETARLVLRALHMEDADFILKEWGDPVVTYYMSDEEPLKTREQAEEMLAPLQTPGKMPHFK